MRSINRTNGWGWWMSSDSGPFLLSRRWSGRTRLQKEIIIPTGRKKQPLWEGKLRRWERGNPGWGATGVRGHWGEGQPGYGLPGWGATVMRGNHEGWPRWRGKGWPGWGATGVRGDKTNEYRDGDRLIPLLTVDDYPFVWRLLNRHQLYSGQPLEYLLCRVGHDSY